VGLGKDQYVGFTRSGLRRSALFLGAASAFLVALGIANHAGGFVGDSSWTYLALAAGGAAAIGAVTNLWLSRVIDEQGHFVRREDESPAAPLRRGFPVWLHLPLTAFVAFLFVLVGVGVSWWVAVIFAGPLLAIDVLALVALPLASKLDDVHRGERRPRRNQ
jgi:hypothetical protein